MDSFIDDLLVNLESVLPLALGSVLVPGATSRSSGRIIAKPQMPTAGSVKPLPRHRQRHGSPT